MALHHVAIYSADPDYVGGALFAADMDMDTTNEYTLQMDLYTEVKAWRRRQAYPGETIIRIPGAVVPGTQVAGDVRDESDRVLVRFYATPLNTD